MGIGAVIELRVVLAKRSFEKQETGLQGHCRPLCQLVRVLGRRKVVDCEVDVFYHLAEDEFTAVAGTVEFLGFGRAYLGIIPGDISEALYLLRIEIRTEEACDCFELYSGLCILAIGKIVQKGVHIAQGAPAPAAAGSRYGTDTAKFIGSQRLCICVCILLVKIGIREHGIEVHRESHHFRVVLEESFGSHLALRSKVEHVVAGDEEHAAGNCNYDIFNLFHGCNH